MNTYICYFKNKRIEVSAATQYEAQQKAAAIFKARRHWEVAVMIAEKNGVPVIHSTASI